MVSERLKQIEKLCEYEFHKQTSKRRIFPVYYSDKLPLYQDEIRFLKALFLSMHKETKPEIKG